jgi:hypothetical protein
VTTVSVRLPGTSQSVDVTVGANESLSDALTATMARLGTLKRVRVVVQLRLSLTPFWLRADTRLAHASSSTGACTAQATA